MRLHAHDIFDPNSELFGNRFVEAYTATRDSQDREFRAVVTDAELRRFFELA